MIEPSSAAPVRSRPRSWPCTVVQLVTAALSGWAAVMSPHGTGVRLAIIAVLCVCSIVFRWGWLVPCAVLGFAGGIFSDLHIKGGPLDAQVDETCWCIGMGMFFGLAIGFMADAVQHR
jgi:hypothetical protein